jgi:hypothetical protein
MARTVRGRKGGAKKAAPKKSARTQSAPKAKAKAKAAMKAAPVRKAVAKASAKKPAPKKALAKTSVSRAAVKKATARVSAARRAPARRTRPAVPPPRKVAARKLKAAAPVQDFTVSHLNEADFKPDGLRDYALYRDLGIAAATSGLCQAHVIRLQSPCTDEVRKRHVHAVELQLIYVLRGWIKNEFEGHGVQMMSPGSCWLQPPGIRHTVLDYSPDVELLEIIVPADFKTVEAD